VLCPVGLTAEAGILPQRRIGVGGADPGEITVLSEWIKSSRCCHAALHVQLRKKTGVSLEEIVGAQDGAVADCVRFFILSIKVTGRKDRRVF
jgi:hypothetical protein